MRSDDCRNQLDVAALACRGAAEPLGAQDSGGDAAGNACVAGGVWSPARCVLGDVHGPSQLAGTDQG